MAVTDILLAANLTNPCIPLATACIAIADCAYLSETICLVALPIDPIVAIMNLVRVIALEGIPAMLIITDDSLSNNIRLTVVAVSDIELIADLTGKNTRIAFPIEDIAAVACLMNASID